MTYDTFLSLVMLAFGTLYTPGPNNAMLANSGATFGVKRSVPHTLGVATGFGFMLTGVSVGLGAVFEWLPQLRTALLIVSVGVLLWLAYKIAMTGSLSRGKGEARPFTYTEAVAFQWINPKAWAMAMSVTVGFASSWMSSAIAVVTFVLLGLGSAFGWMLIGAALQKWLEIGDRLKWFNRFMAALIVLSVFLMLKDAF
ncbi:MAG: LysE family translocator [Halocynthiibacter sp.]